MAMSLDRIEIEALGLSRQERAFLADRLLARFIGPEGPEDNVCLSSK